MFLVSLCCIIMQFIQHSNEPKTIGSIATCGCVEGITVIICSCKYGMCVLFL